MQELQDPSDAIPNATQTALDALRSTEPRGDVAEGADVAPLVVRALDDAAHSALVASLSISARKTIGVADALRRERGRDAVHVEHLLAALLDGDVGHQAAPLLAARLTAATLVERFRAFELELRNASDAGGQGPLRFSLPRVEPATAMPALSTHARRAIDAAVCAAGWQPSDRSQAGRVRAVHLLVGAFAVRDCHVIQAFDAERGTIHSAIVTDYPRSHDYEVVAADLRDELARVSALFAGPPHAVFESAPTAEAPPPATPAASAPRTGTGGGAANDQAEGDDRLNFSHYVQAFANLIDSPDTRPPLTIGIFGAWGSGKSFLLRHLTDEIRRRGKALRPSARTQFARWLRETLLDKPEPVTRAYVYCVSFNAWEYNAADHIWPRLVRRVLDSVTHNAQWSPWQRARKVRRKFERNFTRKLKTGWKGLVAMLVVGAGIWWGFAHLRPQAAEQFARRVFGVDLNDDKFSVPAVVGALTAIVKLVVDTILAPLGGWLTALVDDGPGYGSESDFVRAVRADLDLVDEQLTAEGSRVLIMIDDLDRCEPNKAVEVLQAINLLLDRRSFVVVLGIDARVVIAAVEKHYEALLGPAGVTGYEYLDKIIQIPFRIPEPTGDELALFVSKQLGDPAPDERGHGTISATPRPSLFGAEGVPSTSAPRPLSPLSLTELPDEVIDAGADAARKIVEGPAGAVLGTVAPGVRFALGQGVEITAEMLRAPAAPPVALSFTHDELEAFRAVAGMLRPNPRHVKRLVNVYALVRSLAELANNRTILDDPAATVRWLTLCAQWPYATRTMLVHLDTFGPPPDTETTPPLQWLHQAVTPRLDPAKCLRFDHEPLALGRLVASSDGLSWDELRVLRAYTVNFNPALDAEVRVAEPPRRVRRRTSPA